MLDQETMKNHRSFNQNENKWVHETTKAFRKQHLSICVRCQVVFKKVPRRSPAMMLFLIQFYSHQRYMCTHVKRQGVVTRLGMKERSLHPLSLLILTFWRQTHSIFPNSYLVFTSCDLSPNHMILWLLLEFSLLNIIYGLPTIDYKDLTLFLTPSYHPYSHDPSPSNSVLPNISTCFQLDQYIGCHFMTI